ncbi:MAG: CO dehydrogenase/CO-methylating acetyl-CoA synthase complex subunit beta, partial [Methanomicrobiales archaeon]|nr:CO dehydrogenase/CO-methylating acetyl-CoA synthase complex subunit beta [Methanomicrobiales archaeon]
MTEIGSAVRNGREELARGMRALSGALQHPETAYHLPIAFALTGIAVHDAGGARDAYGKAGNHPLVAAEALRAARIMAQGPDPSPFTGFVPDTVIRKLGYTLVDGSILGMALLVGTPQSADAASAIARELQEKYMLTFLAGPVIPVLSKAGVKVGLDYRLVPLGSTPDAGVHFAD